MEMNARPSKFRQRFWKINEQEISLEDNLDVQVENFSDSLELKGYLEENMTIKFIVVTSDESA